MVERGKKAGKSLSADGETKKNVSRRRGGAVYMCPAWHPTRAVAVTMTLLRGSALNDERAWRLREHSSVQEVEPAEHSR